MKVNIAPKLLFDALVLPLPQAEESWRRWRSTVDLEHLDQAAVQFLPAVAGRLPEWLVDDPKQAMFIGICRQAWSQNQLRKKVLTDAVQLLRDSGIDRVAATGPALWGELYWPAGSIRPITIIDLLIEPASVPPALNVLGKVGWSISGHPPNSKDKGFQFAPATVLQSASGSKLRVHWRALPNTDLSLRRPEFPELITMPPGKIAPHAIPAEYSLAAVLGGNLDDAMDWRCDALMICSGCDLDWLKIASLLRWRSSARTRLEELRPYSDQAIPLAVTGSSWTGPIERKVASLLRTYRRLAKAM